MNDFLGREMRRRLRMREAPPEELSGGDNSAAPEGFGGGAPVRAAKGEPSLDEQIREKVFGGGSAGGTEFTV